MIACCAVIGQGTTRLGRALSMLAPRFHCQRFRKRAVPRCRPCTAAAAAAAAALLLLQAPTQPRDPAVGDSLTSCPAPHSASRTQHPPGSRAFPLLSQTGQGRGWACPACARAGANHACVFQGRTQREQWRAQVQLSTRLPLASPLASSPTQYHTPAGAHLQVGNVLPGKHSRVRQQHHRHLQEGWGGRGAGCQPCRWHADMLGALRLSQAAFAAAQPVLPPQPDPCLLAHCQSPLAAHHFEYVLSAAEEAALLAVLLLHLSPAQRLGQAADARIPVGAWGGGMWEATWARGQQTATSAKGAQPRTLLPRSPPLPPPLPLLAASRAPGRHTLAAPRAPGTPTAGPCCRALAGLPSVPCRTRR